MSVKWLRDTSVAVTTTTLVACALIVTQPLILIPAQSTLKEPQYRMAAHPDWGICDGRIDWEYTISTAWYPVRGDICHISLILYSTTPFTQLTGRYQSGREVSVLVEGDLPPGIVAIKTNWFWQLWHGTIMESPYRRN